MKKIIIIFFAVIISIIIYKGQKNDAIIIPDNAIRLRIIPNSNSYMDQTMKERVKEYLENNTYQLLENEQDINEAREIIKKNIPNIKQNINKIFEENKYNKDYRIEYGNNYFPEKEYHGIKYKEGYYESIVVSIGNAEGDNWWCVLFPNLCLVDLKNKKDITYKSWVVDIIKK